MSQESAKFRILFVISHFYRPVGSRETFRRGGHERPTPNAEMVNRRNRRRRATDPEKQKADPGIRKIPDAIRNFHTFPPRSAPGGSVGRRGVAGRAILDARRKCLGLTLEIVSRTRRIADFLAHRRAKC